MLNITIDKQSEDAFVLSIEGEETQTLTRAQMDELHNEIDRIEDKLTDNFDKMIEGEDVENLFNDTYRLPFLTQRYTTYDLGDISAYYLQYVKGYIDMVATHQRATEAAQAIFADID